VFIDKPFQTVTRPARPRASPAIAPAAVAVGASPWVGTWVGFHTDNCMLYPQSFQFPVTYLVRQTGPNGIHVISDNSDSYSYVTDGNVARYGADGVVFTDVPISMVLDGDTLAFTDAGGHNPAGVVCLTGTFQRVKS
jgi:hypothetical protein